MHSIFRFSLILILLIKTFAFADVSNGLIGWWKLDDGSGTSATDTSNVFGATAHNGTVTGSPTWTTGKLGGALSFSGSTSQYVSIATATVAGKTSGTICAWINTSDSVNQQAILTYAVIADTTHEVRFSINPVTGSTYIIMLANTGGTANWVRGNTALATSTWYHVCATGNGTTWNLYVNGKKETLTVGAGTNAGTWYSAVTGKKFLIGLLTRTTSVIPFNGKIDDVRVYSRVLSDAEIWDIFQNERQFYGGE